MSVSYPCPLLGSLNGFYSVPGIDGAPHHNHGRIPGAVQGDRGRGAREERAVGAGGVDSVTGTELCVDEEPADRTV